MSFARSVCAFRYSSAQTILYSSTSYEWRVSTSNFLSPRSSSEHQSLMPFFRKQFAPLYHHRKFFLRNPGKLHSS
ncbi:hypothetical protein BDQ12DRAFT_692353 [Crucibulum laeve]|uniref:Uncharacterized protein n=1 Tax=Crucibulum laeve TaxID=68775 RepID=A0A5C3LHI1_9AGAR|nr:hypothetical protein BDQ12DRAFT_692353 [Crucibulum laeve]